MSTIEFTCTSCGKKIKTGSANAGKKGKCPKCGAVLDIPLSPEQSLMPPTSPPAPMNPAPMAETPVRPPARPKGEHEMYGASSGGSHANQDFLSELAGPAQPGAAAQQDLFAGTDDAAAAAYGTSPGLTPLPASPQPAYTPSSYSPPPTYSAGNPYAAPAAPVYGGYAAPPRASGSGADGMGITSMILGIVGLVLSLLSFCLSCAYIGVIGYPVALICSIVGVILGHVARPSGMRIAGLVMNYINLAIYIAMIVIVVVMLILFGSLAALSPR